MKHRAFIFSCIILLMLAFRISADGWNSFNVELIGREPFGSANDVYTVGDYAYLCAGGVLVILDVSIPAAPMAVGRLDTPGVASGISVSNNYAYICSEYTYWNYHHSGLRVVDVSDPANPPRGKSSQ